jgi:hypothetical protein
MHPEHPHTITSATLTPCRRQCDAASNHRKNSQSQRKQQPTSSRMPIWRILSIHAQTQALHLLPDDGSATPQATTEETATVSARRYGTSLAHNGGQMTSVHVCCERYSAHSCIGKCSHEYEQVYDGWERAHEPRLCACTCHVQALTMSLSITSASPHRSHRYLTTSKRPCSHAT